MVRIPKAPMPKATAPKLPKASVKPFRTTKGRSVSPPAMSKMTTQKPFQSTPTEEIYKKGMKRGK